MRDDPIITQCHEHQQLLGQRARLRRAASNQRCRAQVEDDEVRLSTHRESSDLTVEAQSTGTAQSCEIERAQRGQVLMRELGNFVGVAECAQHAEVVASADIGCYREWHAGGICGSYVKQPAAEIEIGSGAEGCSSTGLRHPRAVGLIQVNAVGVNCAVADQPITVVDVEIAAGLRKQLLY